ncbi:hypothetical protein RFM41_15100 [Mesorhizobium sp. VK25A]|uniref:LPXTG cell wall anchor domain-containing protein n=1 Tax=Mesorhizobium vachelliae TaxID=3072309 RepID=A0ABU5A7K1_9HYPH|nr:MULTISPECIES: hypothetical protein [unclassified Mesorhizobium]MDX8533155.1 hypothetical protein [Mesorhizobium sp. VK25D]MDX8545074.1 hypothetical protein [Mesorhizobium sp. VK25A]
MDGTTKALLANKLIAIGLLVIGFLIFASGYRYGSPSSIVVGCLLVAIGIILLILKIARRNRPDSAA